MVNIIPIQNEIIFQNKPIYKNYPLASPSFTPSTAIMVLFPGQKHNTTQHDTTLLKKPGLGPPLILSDSHLQKIQSRISSLWLSSFRTVLYQLFNPSFPYPSPLLSFHQSCPLIIALVSRALMYSTTSCLELQESRGMPLTMGASHHGGLRSSLGLASPCLYCKLLTGPTSHFSHTTDIPGFFKE